MLVATNNFWSATSIVEPLQTCQCLNRTPRYPSLRLAIFQNKILSQSQRARKSVQNRLLRQWKVQKKKNNSILGICYVRNVHHYCHSHYLHLPPTTPYVIYKNWMLVAKLEAKKAIPANAAPAMVTHLNPYLFAKALANGPASIKFIKIGNRLCVNILFHVFFTTQIPQNLF